MFYRNVRHVLYCLFILLTSLQLANAQTLIITSAADAYSEPITTIINGIASVSDDVIINRQNHLSDNANYDSFEKIILLGNDAYESHKNIKSNTIAAGFFGNDLNNNKAIRTYPLLIDPAILLQEANKTGMQLRNIYTVSTENTSPYLNSASAAFNESNTNLIVIIANNVKSTARSWFNVSQEINPKTDAIWIHDSRYLEESGSLRHLIEHAWRNDIYIFSSVPRLSNKGVSLGFIPELFNYGVSLANTDSDSIKELPTAPTYITELSSFSRVFNRRTLHHIGRFLPDDVDSNGYTDIIIR